MQTIERTTEQVALDIDEEAELTIVAEEPSYWQSVTLSLSVLEPLAFLKNGGDVILPSIVDTDDELAVHARNNAGEMVIATATFTLSTPPPVLGEGTSLVAGGDIETRLEAVEEKQAETATEIGKLDERLTAIDAATVVETPTTPAAALTEGKP